MPRLTRREDRSGRIPEPLSWGCLLAGCVAAMGAKDAVLLELGSTYFSAGFNALYLDSLQAIALFFLLAAVLDATLVLGLWALMVPVVKRLPGTRLQHFAVVGLVTLEGSFFADYLRYSLHYVLGDLVSPLLLWAASGRDSSEVWLELTTYAGPTALVVLAAGIGMVGALSVLARLARRVARVDPRFAPPRTPALWVSFAIFFPVASGILIGTSMGAPRIHFGLASKASSAVLMEIIRHGTDIDGDGFGLLSVPPDPDPFEASVHPFALDLPGNGVDENGVGGDHPPGFEAVRPSEHVPIRGSRRPQVLVVFLESFRADLIGSRLRGREVTPFLNRLARDGARSGRAFVHTPGTAGSRAEFFGGRLIPYPGQSTLIDDFKSLGYTVALFSGQDDSYGNSEVLMGVDRADVFYDARRDVERRISRSSSPVGLQISWKLLNRRVFEFLETHRSEQPLFLYVNFTDTHFPYHHRELDDLLGVDPLPKREVNVDQVERIRETYANAAANVDRAVEQLVAAWREHFDGRDLSILVTSDHAQEIFEHGFLGHGHSVNPEQTRVPFILWGIGGDWPEPLGLADVRGLLRRCLFVEEEGWAPRARFAPDPARTLLQFAGHWNRPRSLALRGVERSTVYQVQSGRLQILDGEEQPIEVSPEAERRALESLIWNWEGVRLRARADRERAAPAARSGRSPGAGEP